LALVVLLSVSIEARAARAARAERVPVLLKGYDIGVVVVVVVAFALGEILLWKQVAEAR
jgi:hypothetical protein